VWFDSTLNKGRNLILKRRDFLKAGSAALASSFLYAGRLSGQTLSLPLGLELYSVREYLPTDYAGTLKKIGALGYREVESAHGYFNHSVAEVKQAMQDAKLKVVSAAYSFDDLHPQFDQILEFNKALGVGYIICVSPGFKDPMRIKNMKPAETVNALTLDDWRWSAEAFNRMGEKTHAAGMKFGYHNHTVEFRRVDGVVPYLELLRLTDPSKVTMEMDCGWVIVAGGNPVDYLREYPTRISMLHVKDFKRIDPAAPAKDPVAAELGQGVIDYRPIFEAAGKTGNVKHCFVEQEQFDVPPMESLAIDAAYMRKLGAVQESARTLPI
jgi:sugar phosphate isomerase/epimerase